MMYFICMVLFFVKQKTAYEMRISDWSSDVCSSDLSLDGCVRLIDIPLNYCRLGRGQGPKASQKLKRFRKGKGERSASLKSSWQGERGRMTGRLEGKRCLITGTGGGIGRASALWFAQEGGQIIGGEINAERAEIPQNKRRK